MGSGEILARLNYAQGRLYTRLAQENRFFYLRSATVASSNAAMNRTLDLSTLNPPIERLMEDGLLLPGGAVVNVVDFQDQGAALAPRAFPTGLVLNEVGSEWGATGAITFTVWYVYRPVDLVVTGALTQLMNVPDRFLYYFDYDLAIYCFGKDTGRVAADPGGLERLAAQQEAVYADLLQYLDHVMGPAIRRFALPVSAKGEKA